MKKKNIIIIGAGGHAEACIDLVEKNNTYKVKFVVGTIKEKNKIILGKYKVIFTDKDLKDLSRKFKYALIGVGQIKSSALRIKIFNNLKNKGFNIPKIISPHAVISKYSEIGEGTVIMHGSIIGPNVKIGKNCIINSKSLIEHGTSIGNNTHVATSVTINSGVKIGSNCFVGSNSSIRQLINIKSGSFVKMCSKITRNV